MLETNITNIENKEFLLNHDFYDLPGINELEIIGNNKPYDENLFDIFNDIKIEDKK